MSPSIGTPVRIKREDSVSPTTHRQNSKSDRSRNSANATLSTSQTTAASSNADILQRASFQHQNSVEQLLEKRPDLRLIDVSQLSANMGGVDTLGPDEEIWMFQCARNVPIQKLVGCKLNLSGDRKTVRLPDSGALEYQSDAAVGRTHTMVCRPHGGRRHQLVSFQPVGTVRVHDEIQELLVADIAHVKPALVPYPTGLKVRHPLHGNDYEKLTNLPADVKSKLRTAVRDSARARSEQQPQAAAAAPTIKQERTGGSKRTKAERSVAVIVEPSSTKTETTTAAVAGKKRKATAEVEAESPVSSSKKSKRVKKEHVKQEAPNEADEDDGANLDWLSAI